MKRAVGIDGPLSVLGDAVVVLECKDQPADNLELAVGQRSFASKTRVQFLALDATALGEAHGNRLVGDRRRRGRQVIAA